MSETHNMTDPQSLMDRLDRVESELAIQRLIHEYCHGADKQDLERFAAIWDDDAAWVTSPDQRFDGIEAICAAVQEQWAAFKEMHHWTANFVVDIDGDRAVGEADVAVRVQLTDGTWVRGGGTYQDVYVRRDGRWRVARREVVSSFEEDPLPPGIGSPAD
ncbi:nuclear transport factor 2 family protein [Streptosporangium lutulentum]